MAELKLVPSDLEAEPDPFADVKAAFADAEPKPKRAKPEPEPEYESEAARFTAEYLAREALWGDDNETDLDRLADAIRGESRDVVQNLRSALASAWRGGALLTEAKAQVSHGEWLPWLAENVSISERTAQSWIKLATLTLAEAKEHGSIAAALAAMAGSSTKSAATSDLLDRVAADRAADTEYCRTVHEEWEQREAARRAERAAERAEDKTPYIRPTAEERAEDARREKAQQAATRAEPKVEALLAKAISTTEPHERAAFFDKACAMLAKHNLVVSVRSRPMPFGPLW